MEKEPSNQTHAAQTQIFSTNVTQQVKSSEKLVYTLNFQVIFGRFWTCSGMPSSWFLQEPLNESPASPLSQQIETHVYSPNSAQHVCAQNTVLTVCVFRSNVWKLLYIFMMAFLIFCRLRKSNWMRHLMVILKFFPQMWHNMYMLKWTFF